MTLFSRKPMGRKAVGGRKTSTLLLLLLAVAIALEALAFLSLADDATTAAPAGSDAARAARAAGADDGAAGPAGPKEDDMCMQVIYGTPYKVQCSTLRRQNVEKMKEERAAAARQRAPREAAPPPPPSVPEGSPVRCADEDDGDIYRYTTGHLRKYPSLEMADYWHEGWGAAIRTIACARVPRGPAMTTNNDEIDCVPVVKCFQETSQAIYRYLGGTLRQYPSTEVADSWVPNWRDAVEVIDCADVRRGPGMTAKDA